MTPSQEELNRLTPGIKYLFRHFLGQVDVALEGKLIRVTLTHSPDAAESRTFPFPSVNSDLSAPLGEWWRELGGK